MRACANQRVGGGQKVLTSYQGKKDQKYDMRILCPFSPTSGFVAGPLVQYFYNIYGYDEGQS